ncbi:hypothetical protein MPNT_80087 [Candidatus Methylacidithermus pantelleriae]|uniref:Uncharacterized protein n=1 Tax=Candidatus Methylacidithermus pantelleriae TaxID=2744239 RepID=A0A8J2FXG2_9BACT|nr:hypothetical protein MPNT_80087 [Candidatus Methylacidithermus pantelleriae]
MLNTYAVLYGRAQRNLFAQMQASVSPKKLKRAFLTRFDPTAREFHVLRVQARRKDCLEEQTAEPKLIEEAKGWVPGIGKGDLQARAKEAAIKRVAREKGAASHLAD